MALIKPVRIQSPFDTDVVVYKWGPATEADTYEALVLPLKTDQTMQNIGSMGGASMGLSGSLQAELTAPTVFGVLKDAQGTAIAHTVTGDVDTVLEAMYWYIPVMTGGTSASITTYLFGK